MGVQKVRRDVYLIAIDQLCNQSGAELASTGQIAKGLGIAAGIVSTTLKQLVKDSLIILQPYEGAKLTEAGRNRLRKVHWRLRLIEMWLSTSLNLEKDFLTEEAMRIESVASARLMEALDSALGHPEFDRGDGSSLGSC